MSIQPLAKRKPVASTIRTCFAIARTPSGGSRPPSPGGFGEPLYRYTLARVTAASRPFPEPGVRFRPNVALGQGRSLPAGQSRRHGVVQGMAGAGGDDVGLDGAAGEGQIADQVQELVARGLVVEAVGVVDRAGGADDH